MATVTTPATLSSVKSVFGGASTLYGYRRNTGGGGLVPNYSAYSGVSDSAPRLASFAGLVNPLVAGSTIYIENQLSGRTEVGARVNFYSNGQCQLVRSNSTTGDTVDSQFTWLLGGSAADFGLKVNSNSGWTLTGMSVGTAYQLNSTRNWYALTGLDTEITPGLSYSIVDWSSGTSIVTFGASALITNGIPP